MSLDFCPPTTQSEVLLERFAYKPQRVTFPVMLCPCDPLILLGHALATVAADGEFL
jgi:hypothetical protein